MDLSTEFGQFIQLLLLATLPTLAVAALGYALKAGAGAWAAFKSTNRDKAYILEAAVELAVKAAEQSALKAGLVKAGKQKLEWATKFAQEYLALAGVKVDFDFLVAAIESEVIKNFPNVKKLTG